MKNKDPKTKKIVFTFEVSSEENRIYEIDYNNLVSVVNDLFDWDFVDASIRNMHIGKPTQEEIVGYYNWFFIDLIKDGKCKYGGWEFGENGEKMTQRRLEIKKSLDKYAKRLS